MEKNLKCKQTSVKYGKRLERFLYAITFTEVTDISQQVHYIYPRAQKYDTKQPWGQKSASKGLLIGHIGIRISIRWLVIVPPDSFMIQRHPVWDLPQPSKKIRTDFYPCKGKDYLFSIEYLSIIQKWNAIQDNPNVTLYCCNFFSFFRHGIEIIPDNDPGSPC